MVTAKFSGLEPENATLQKKLETSSRTQANTEAGLAYILEGMRDDLERRREIVSRLEQKLANTRKD